MKILALCLAVVVSPLVAVQANSSPEVVADKGAPAAKKAKTLEGTFLGIEQGDYFHWNMKTADGEERSFFILKPDESVNKMVDKPEAFVGKKCRITWKTSTENIPEAGGKMEVEQILSVEWLGKK
ncbi:MAG: hypothetical protein JNM99_04490 [Verrucomicrobiaceae bacterium]|nr:hypothetical protein [Verrucomicrobiaceae bacterium]